MIMISIIYLRICFILILTSMHLLCMHFCLVHLTDAVSVAFVKEKSGDLFDKEITSRAYLLQKLL